MFTLARIRREPSRTGTEPNCPNMEKTHSFAATLKKEKKKEEKIPLIASRDADLYCLYCHWDLKGALMAGASQC